MLEIESCFVLFSYPPSFRLQCTTKGTKALRLLGGDGKRGATKDQDPTLTAKESVLAKLASRNNFQRRLLLKNGEVNISRYPINFCFDMFNHQI
jgi:hypothetical protein